MKINPLATAMWKNDTKIVKMLLKHGANIETA